jgi:hypothetical protein
MKEVYYVGLDVHKDSIQMAVLDSRKKEPIAAKGLPNRATRIVKELTGYQEKGNRMKSLWDFFDFLHVYAKIPINGLREPLVRWEPARPHRLLADKHRLLLFVIVVTALKHVPQGVGNGQV